MSNRAAHPATASARRGESVRGRIRDEIETAPAAIGANQIVIDRRHRCVRIASPQSSSDGGIGNAPMRSTVDMIRCGKIFHAPHRRMMSHAARQNRYAIVAYVPAWHHAARFTRNPQPPRRGRKNSRGKKRARKPYNPQVERSAHLESEHPRNSRAHRKQRPHSPRAGDDFFRGFVACRDKSMRSPAAARMIEVNVKSMMNSQSQATRRCEIGYHMRVPNDVIPSRTMWLAMPTP